MPTNDDYAIGSIIKAKNVENLVIPGNRRVTNVDTDPGNDYSADAGF